MEFEPADAGDNLASDISNVRSAIDQLANNQKLDLLYKQSVRFIKMMTGFDRVMLYQFDIDGSGIVTAEALKPGMEPYLNLRYPATDIPKQARALYIENPIRLIADATHNGVNILAAGDQDTSLPFDLSGSRLRSVSPIHLEYLRNMGVAASMSISLIINGQLWGLFACHHEAPYVPTMRQRNSALLFGQMLSLLIETKLSAMERENDERVSEITTDISRSIAAGSVAVEVLVSSAKAFSGILRADGFAVVQEGRVISGGTVPENEDIHAICDKLNTLPGNEVFSTNNLTDFIEAAAAYVDRAAGFLSIPISRSPRDYILFFRQETVSQVNWAGNPDKPVVSGPNGDRLTPRKSFQVWQQTVKGQSAAWLPKDIRAAAHLRVMLLEVVLRLTDEAGQERKIAAERQEVLIAELNHRVRNILGLVRGLIHQSVAGEESASEFVRKLDSRVQALARAHDQITRQNWSPTPFRQLIKTEAESYLVGKQDRVLVTGPIILLSPQAFSSIALVMHEMLTNSAKYGAISDTKGRIEIALKVEDDGMLSIYWVEIGGPPVVEPTRRGFGSTIIHRTVPFELGGEADIAYEPDGLKARFSIPAQHFTVATRAETLAGETREARSTASNVPSRVLIVEDNLLIAMQAEEAFQKLGCKDIVIAPTLKTALDALGDDNAAFDFALLDVNLGTDTSFEAARRLKTLGIDFVFASGYGDTVKLPDDIMDSNSIGKPYDSDIIAGLFGAA
nr:HWE histidine kinase domain-containing protein [Rhizobium sp. L1K21]